LCDSRERAFAVGAANFHLQDRDGLALYKRRRSVGLCSSSVTLLALVFLIVASYATLTHFVKVWFVTRWGM
jgi:hypothetical protein